MIRILGSSQFDQCVLTLVHLCNQESYVGQQLHPLYRADDSSEPTNNPWLTPHWFTIYIPHPDQEFEEFSLEQGLTRGYNVEVKQINHLDHDSLYPTQKSTFCHSTEAKRT